MVIGAAPASWWNPCSWGPLKAVCGAVTDAAKAAGTALFDTIIHPIVDAFGSVFRSLMTFWIKVPTPDFQDPSGPVAHLQHINVWLTSFVGCISLIIAAGILAFTRNERSSQQILRGIVTIVLAGAAVPIVSTLAHFLDGYSAWILTQDTQGFDDRAGVFLAGISSMGPGMLLVMGVPLILMSVTQIVLLIIRVGVLTILLGLLPLIAATATTEWGERFFRRTCGWILAFLIYAPVAATIYSAAFLMVGTSGDLTSALSGVAVLALAIIALPALMRAIVPAVEAVTFSGGGGMLAGGVALAATGAKAVAGFGSGEGGSGGDSSTGTGSNGGGGENTFGAWGNEMSDTGATGSGAAGGAAGAGGKAGTGAAGGAGGAGAAGGSAAAAGGVGAAILAGTQVKDSVKGAAEGSIPKGPTGSAEGDELE